VTTSVLASLIGVGSLTASSSVVTLPPTDDAEVRESSPHSNHGTNAIMWVQSAGCGRNRRIFLKFDLSAVPPGSIITRARLYLYCQDANFADLNVQVRAVDNDDWAECGITWKNQPSYGEVLDNILIPKCGSFRWYCWDVTSFVRAEFSGDGVASFCLRADRENADGKVGFRSKEHGVTCTRPHLEVCVTVDTTPPISSVDAISPYWQKSTSFTVTATASDDLSGVARVGLWYRHSSDNSSWGPWRWFENDNASPWSWTFNSPSGIGYYQFYSTARDSAGNEEAAPVAADAICGVDNIPPTKPSCLKPSGGAWTNDNTPKLSWAAATDALSGISHYEVQVDNDANFGSLENTGVTTSTNYTVGNELSEGTWYWRVRAVDRAGNAGDWENSWFRVDVTPPGKPTLASPENNKLDNSLNQTFKWTQPPENSLPLTYHIRIDDEASFAFPYVHDNSAVIDNAYTYTFSVDGTYYWRVRARDKAGNWGTWSDNFKLTLDTTPPSPPSLSSPADGTITNDNTPTFDWSDVVDAVEYRLQVDNDSNFSSPEISVLTGASTYTPTTALAEENYSWRVQARDSANNWGPWSSVWTFVVDVTPPSSSVGAISPYWRITSPVMITAAASDGVGSGVSRVALWYRYSSDNSSWGAWTWFENDNAMPWSWSFNYPNGNGYYEFYSTARDNAGNEEEPPDERDALCGFDDTPPGRPTPTSPTDGSWENDNTPHLSWTAASDALSGVDYYNIQVDDNSDFSSPENIGVTTSTNYTVGNELREGTWYWRVRAVDRAGNAGTWENSWFMIDVTPPGRPSLISPENNRVDNKFDQTFTWTKPEAGLTFHIQIDNEPSFVPPHVHENSSVADNSYTFTLTADGVYYWRVRAEDAANNWGPWADSFKLEIDTAPPARPTLVSPENNAVRSTLPITFTWTRPEPDVTYSIQIDDEASFTQPYLHENAAVSENLYLFEFASAGTYYWRVRAKDRAGNWGAWSENFKLTIQLPPGLPGKPSLMSPENGTVTTDNTPTFRWTPGENADNHRLLVDNDSNFSSPMENRLLGATDNTYTPAAGYPDGNYFWRVVAINEAGENSSEVWTFAIDATPPAKPTLIWPADGENINDNTPNLDWGAVSDASPPLLYRVRVSDNSAFPHDNVDSGWIAADNFKLQTQLREGVWYWRVQARDNAGNIGENSSTRSFRVDVTPPPAPTLLEPADGATTTDDTPTFRWAAVVDLSMPITYRLQVDNDPGFSSPEMDVLRLIDNSHTPTAGLPQENYSWRVQARDNAGNVGAWSSVRTFLITAARGVNVTISPGENGGMPNETLTYRVTVKNTGDIRDGYVLTVSDNMNWGPKLSDNRFENVQPGENRVTTLTITIPGGAVHGARDNIVVVATSLINAGVKDSASCIARAMVLGVSVAISPSSAKGAPRQTLTYVVVVKNTGGAEDSYSLSVADTLGWRPALSDNRFEGVLPGEKRSAALSVIVPENASAGAEDEITVRVTSEVDPDVGGERPMQGDRRCSAAGTIDPARAGIDLDRRGHFYDHLFQAQGEICQAVEGPEGSCGSLENKVNYPY
jgi:hypothetical protein